MTLDIFDAHIHLWHPGVFDIPWLAGNAASFGNPALIRGRYRSQEFLVDAGNLHVVGGIHVEAAARPEHSLIETTWVTGIADATGLPTGIIGHANLESPEIEADLEALARSPYLCGVRMRLNFDEKSGRRIAKSADVMSEAPFRRGLRAAAKRNLVFNLSVFAPQLSKAAELAEVVPEATLVLEHIGWPLATDEGAFREWRAGMAALAAHPNAAVKISGFWAIDRDWRAEKIRPWVQEAFALFGPDRCMFGSNLPIEKLMCPLPRQVEILSLILARESNATVQAFFANNAIRLYRLG